MKESVENDILKNSISGRKRFDDEQKKGWRGFMEKSKGGS